MSSHDEPGPDVVMDRAFWEGRYDSDAGHVWSGRPNPQLVTEISDQPAGAALDVGCGEGADACWLAQRGWTVTALDISQNALDRAARRAEELGPEVAAHITWVQTDLTTDQLPGSTYDLVTAQFLHLVDGSTASLHRDLAALVRPGGTFLVVGHHQSDVHAGVGRWARTDLLFSAEEVAAVLDPGGWEVTSDGARPREVVDHVGVARTVHDVVLVARRKD